MLVIFYHLKTFKNVDCSAFKYFFNFEISDIQIGIRFGMANSLKVNSKTKKSPYTQIFICLFSEVTNLNLSVNLNLPGKIIATSSSSSLIFSTASSKWDNLNFNYKLCIKMVIISLFNAWNSCHLWSHIPLATTIMSAILIWLF